jgi:hypothetical protein
VAAAVVGCAAHEVAAVCRQCRLDVGPDVSIAMAWPPPSGRTATR